MVEMWWCVVDEKNYFVGVCMLFEVVQGCEEGFVDGFRSVIVFSCLKGLQVLFDGEQFGVQFVYVCDVVVCCVVVVDEVEFY